MSYRPTVSVDFDGVIHSYRSRWQGVSIIPDPPVDGFFDWLLGVYEDGRLRVAIHSSRSSSWRGRRAMKRWMFRHLKEHFGGQVGPLMEPLYIELSEWLSWPWFKPSAVVAIDDRALTFNGSWETPLYSPASMLKFKPWNKP